MIPRYFEILFYSTVTGIIVSLVLILLLRLKIFWKNREEFRNNLLAFLKKVIIIGVIILPISLVFSLTTPDARKRIYSDKNDYINACFMDAQKATYDDSTKVRYIYSSYDYLYSKYGDSIYYSDFKFSEKDKIELKVILYFATHPQLTDSDKVIIKSKINSSKEISNLLK